MVGGGGGGVEGGREGGMKTTAALTFNHSTLSRPLSTLSRPLLQNRINSRKYS